ncbi:LemA family protein [Vibrio vulnificus]|nr:LemA family protein [Vibrio vulnificus]
MELLIIVGFILIVGLVILGIHNTIISRFNRCKQAWSDVLAYTRQRENIIPKLEEMAEQFKNYEGEILKSVTELRNSLSALQNKGAEFDVEALAKVQQVSRGITATFEDYPELQSAGLYQSFMKELSSQESNIGAAIVIYNSNVQEHNTGIEQFPNSWVNAKFTNKVKIEEFSDTKSSEEFDYKPNFS